MSERVDLAALTLFVRFVRMNPDLDDPQVLVRAFEAYRDNVGKPAGALCSPTYDRQPFDDEEIGYEGTR